MRWEQPVQYASLSDIGLRRHNNQDACAVQICSDQATWRERGHLVMVADGMGGHAVGELASKIAVDTVPHAFYKTRDREVPLALKAAVEVANENIYQRGSHNRDFERMGTTCTALVFSPQGAVIGHVGDSRVYRIRRNRIDQLTFDHSLQWELLRQGNRKADEVFLHEPRNVITRSLGPEPRVEVDIEGPFPVLPGDTFVLCSDGLTGHLNDSEIGTIARELSPGEACRLLVNLANLRGGSDNVTVVIARVGEIPAGASAPEDDSIRPYGGLDWRWMAGYWASAVAFVAGVSLALFERTVEGLVLAALSIIALSGLLVGWFRVRRRVVVGSRALAETALWKPYRTASARLTRDFLSHLAAIEAGLRRAAGEEQWAINWSCHEEVVRKAQAAFAEKKYTVALAEFARSIDVLSAGLHEQRRRSTQAQKRGRSAAVPGRE